MGAMTRNGRCERCRQRRALFGGSSLCGHCQDIRKREEKGLCTATLWHGPGHQSNTYCCQKVATHRKHKKRSIHTASYSMGDAEWFGRKAFSGYFDEPPTLEEIDD